jgi:hypothetical protein
MLHVAATAIADLASGGLAEELALTEAESPRHSAIFRDGAPLACALPPLRAAAAILRHGRLFTAPAAELSGREGFWKDMLDITRACLQPPPSPAAGRARLSVLVYAVDTAAAGLHAAWGRPGLDLLGLVREIFQGCRASGTAGCLGFLLKCSSAEELTAAREAGVQSAVRGGQAAALAVCS